MMFGAIDLAVYIVAVPAFSGVILGGLGEWRSRHRDSDAATAAMAAAASTAKDVATRASEAAIEALQAALDNSLREIKELRADLAMLRLKSDTDKDEHRLELLEVRNQLVQVRTEVADCEADKGRMALRIHELEMSR